MAEVVLKDVSKVFKGNVYAVKDVNLVVESKEFLVIVGPSGCGKTTCLRMIAGLEDISQGQIHIQGRLVNNVPPKDRDIAMVFQNYALYPHMTVYENLAFGLKLRRHPKAEIDARVKEAAEILSITKYLKRKPKELSGGQRQRVAVGRAIVRKRSVFLFDEPLSNLDAKMRVQMRTEINKLHNKLKATMIYVTHDQTEAMTLGDRIVVMRDGLIQQVADPITIYNNPVNKFVAGFIGSPPMNFLVGKVEKDQDGKYYFNEGAFKVRIAPRMYPSISSYEGKTVVFGIRPEDIYDKFFTREPAEGNTVKVVVEVKEPLGAEVYLYLVAGKSNFVARVTEKSIPSVGQQLEVVFDMTCVHFFDVETEKTII